MRSIQGRVSVAPVLGLQVGVAVVGLLAANASGCGGATAQDVLDPPASATTSGGTSGTSGAATSGGTSGNTSGGTSGTTTTSGGGTDAGTDAPPPADGGDCPSETEPNDTRSQANTLGTSLCGAIQPAGESDFLTFQLKGPTTSMQITFTGQVTLRVEVNGQVVILGTGLSPKVPFEKGKTYFIEVKAVDEKAANVPWRVNLIEM